MLRLLLPIFSALFAVFALSGPVFATPTTPTPGETPTSQEETTTETTENAESTEETTSCYDQVGAVGWLICPGTAFLANIIDGAYGLIEQLVRVDPLPTETDAPIYVVWAYIRNITNFIFVFFLLVIVYSQITGLGIKNYGIKRTLPRLIIAAIAVNLSFIICTLAVDISNIVGGSMLDFFDSVLADAIANSKIQGFAGTMSVASIVATVLGVGTVGAVVAMTFTGGVAGVLWALIPIVLSGAIAVISAVVTMAARQALIILLAMISPLAIVCCLLPNTYPWFKRWQKLFVSMLVFYPMFSILYGASRLAGAVIISSATSWLSVVLGVAVQVLPLFFSIPLLRMSNTVLGNISNVLNRAAAPVDRFTRGYSNERRAIARQKQLAKTNPVLPHDRLAKFLEQRRVNRQVDLRDKIATNEDTYFTEARGRQLFKANGKLNRRGREFNSNASIRFLNQGTRRYYETLMDEGFDEADYKNPLHARQIANTNKRFRNAIELDNMSSAYAESVNLKNMEKRAQIIQDGMKDKNSDIYTRAMQTFGAKTSADETRAVSAIVSNAVNAKARVDREARENYFTLYNSYEPGKGIGDDLRKAFDNKDYNSLTAAIEVMAIRGDHDQINSILREKTPSLLEDTPENLQMRKALRDVGIRMKAENAPFWAYCKANLIRAGMNGSGKEIAPFCDFETFMRGETMDGDVDQAAIKKTNSFNILQNIADPTVAKSQDRTVFGDLLDMQHSGIIPIRDDGSLSAGFSIKQLRTGATLGTMEGEQLEALNHLITAGVNKPNVDMAWVQRNHDAIESNILDFVGNTSASQLACMKTATINAINDALIKLNPADVRILNGHRISGKLADAVQPQTAELCRPNAVSDRNRMNPAVREMLGISEQSVKGEGGTQDAR